MSRPRARRFDTVEDVERAYGRLLRLDHEIAYHYLDLGLSAAECGRRLDDRQLERAAFLYERVGLSLAEVARIEGIYPNAVRHRLRAAGVPLRST
jgi:predicted HTH domain antitoxin